MRKLGICLASVILLTITADAHATSGGPTFIEVLGHDVRDGKIYYQVNDHDDHEDPPRVFFVRLDGKHAGKPQRVRSIEKGFGDDSSKDLETLEARVKKLKARLAKMKPTVESKRDESRFEGNDLPKGVGNLKLKRVVKKKVWHEYAEVECKDVAVSISQPKTKLTGAARVRECTKGGVRVTAIYDLKGRSERFVLLSSEAKPYEYGYEVQVPVLLR